MEIAPTYCLLLIRDGARNQHLVNATAIHVHDFNGITSTRHPVARIWNLAEQCHHHTAQRLIIGFILVRHLSDLKGVLKLIHRLHAVDEPGAIFALNHRLLALPLVVG